MIGPLDEPRGWLIPEQAECVRCHRSGGDHHACWLDVCQARTGEHSEHGYVVGRTGVYEITRVGEAASIRGPLGNSARVQVHGVHGDVVDLGPDGALRRHAVMVSLEQRRAWGLE